MRVAYVLGPGSAPVSGPAAAAPVSVSGHANGAARQEHHQQVHKARPEVRARVRVAVQGSTMSCQVQSHKCISRSTHTYVGKAMAGGQPDNHAAHGMGGGEPLPGLEARESNIPAEDPL